MSEHHGQSHGIATSKEGAFEPAAYELDDDQDVQQVQRNNYDPSSDKRDMRRLGKKQELKVGAWSDQPNSML